MDSDALSITELAKLSGVTSRTLRHYDQIGLLAPAWTGSNGYRYYQQSELLRLQRILVLRELGLGLDTIAEVLNGQQNETEALRVHHQWVSAERDRLSRLAHTLETTLTTLERGEIMKTEEIFEGFAHNPYEEEAIQRWGKDAVTKANATWSAMSPTEREAVLAETVAINVELAECQALGLASDHSRVQAAIERHYQWICLSWTPNAEAYRGLGQMYVEDPRFRANYEKSGVTPEYLLAGIEVYAADKLS